VKKFKTQYKDLVSIEKRLTELTLEDCKRYLSPKENIEWENLLKIARKLRVSERKPTLLEIRKQKLEKIIQNTGI